MLFGALFSTYILLRVGAPEGFWPHHWLNVPIGTVNTLVLISSSITTVMAWAACKMKQYERFKFFHACTLILALTFVGIKSYEYHDKFTHYEISLKDGRIADGHLVEKTAEHVVISGRFVTDRKELFDPRASKDGHKHDISRSSETRSSDGKLWSWHNTYLAIISPLQACTRCTLSAARW